MYILCRINNEHLKKKDLHVCSLFFQWEQDVKLASHSDICVKCPFGKNSYHFHECKNETNNYTDQTHKRMIHIMSVQLCSLKHRQKYQDIYIYKCLCFTVHFVFNRSVAQ